MNKFYCANCGDELDSEMGAFILRDNFLIVKYFDNYKSNRFCSYQCACEALNGAFVDFADLPLDDDEEDDDDENK